METNNYDAGAYDVRDLRAAYEREQRRQGVMLACFAFATVLFVLTYLSVIL